MDTTSMGSSSATMGLPTSPSETGAAPPSQLMLLDFFFPGFSVFSAAVQKSLHIDLTIYIPLVLLLGGITFAWRYFSEQIWDLTESHLMSVVDIRTDDEIYNMLMAWVAAQRFSQGARRFVVNTNLNSRSWFLWRWDYDDDDEDDSSSSSDDDSSNLELSSVSKKDRKALAYTPTFGSHWFWYKGRLLIFRRTQNREQSSYLTVSEREEISISCFGRNPWILKELLHEARLSYMKRDEAKTLIYRGTSSRNSSEPTWQRCMARTSRPFSTVILNEKVKKDLIDDVTDYLNPATRRWYSNRGIPYRRGYLLYGPPGTGKSSLSLALAGFFKMRIYIVSLSSPTANEENLASLFAELPRRCVVLLEDIDTAGLTHTREEGGKQGTSDSNNNDGDDGDMVPGQKTAGNNNGNSGRLSLSGLLNILDGVASQEGRVLIMTTNHLEKLDKALIRPGRVDMIVKFDRADRGMAAEIFKAIFAPLEGDDVARPSTTGENGKPLILDAKAEKKKEEKLAQEAKKKSETIAKVSKLAEQFASKVPEREFSPAEIQGYLLKNKRNPEAAVEGAEQFVEDTRREKREKEAKDAEDKKKEKEEAEKKKKKEEEEEKKKKKTKKKSRKEKNKKVEEEEKEEDDSGSSSSSESESESESDSEDEKMKRKKKRKAKKAKAAKKKAAAKKDLKTESKADDGDGEEETTSQQQPLDTPPLTPKKDSFAAGVGFPELLFVKHHGSDIPAITVEEVTTPSTGLGVKGVLTEGGDSGYGTPTASVKGDDELDAVVVSAVPAAAAITAA